MRRYRHIFFDLDHTLWDFAGNSRDTLRELFVELDLETAGIPERNPESPRGQRYEYKLLATSKTSTLQKELQQVAEAGYEAVGMTVGSTALGGSELVVITRRVVK